MDLWEFYAAVENLIHNLRETGYASEADQVETAIRGGTTSGEILSHLSVALPVVLGSVASFAQEADGLAEWVRSTLRSQ